MKMKDEKYPGGLKVAIPLFDKPVEEIISKLVKNDFQPMSLYLPSLVEKAEEHLRILQSEPTNIKEYTEKHKTYIQFSRASELLESAKKLCKDCTVSEAPWEYRDRSDCSLFRGQIQAPKLQKFIEEFDIRERMSLELISDDDEKSYQVGIHKVCLFDGFIVFRGWIPEEERWKKFTACVLPPPLSFRAQMRTLDWITHRTSRNHSSDKFINNYFFFNQEKKSQPIDKDELRQEMFNVAKNLNFSDNSFFNETQKVALCGMVTGHHFDRPYLLCGPPGTGKTHCLLEAVRMLCEINSENRILVCTTSNTTADSFTLELSKTNVSSEKIFRLFSLSKPVEELNPLLKDFVCTAIVDDGKTGFGIWPKEKLLDKFQVIVCTLQSSIYLANGGLQSYTTSEGTTRSCFTHIIIDEAGHAGQIETLIPIVGLAGLGTRVILVGDPKQLGPVEKCEILKKFCEKKSLIEVTQAYRESERFLDNELFTCTLIDNYRSHRLMLKIPSDLFYQGKLRVNDPLQSCSLMNWPGLPSKELPIIFHDIETEEEQEETGFSYSNPAEADLVVEYVRRILAETNVVCEEIGVITPYRAQVRKINDKLRARLLDGIIVDSVERFQGQERRVTIVSTVRSGARGPGFLISEKRFNTTVTRAQELMVIIGNRSKLSEILCWNELIEFCWAYDAIIIGDRI